MRESNFAFPAQNRACVCISSQLYDRRALDTTSPLPLLNSLTHLTYLTSTSPRIREILTCDGGLERLVRLLRDFCLSPPPPENPSTVYGLSPPGLPRPQPVPTLNPKNYDTHAAYRFSLAFQCVVNIGVRGSEPIRSRVVEAGTLEVVGCVLEAWLASKGIAVGPAASASGLPRESREQRALRRQMQNEQRQLLQQREQAQELMRILQVESRFVLAEGDEQTEGAQEQGAATVSDAETSVSTDTSANATPVGSSTPTGSVVVPGRDRSGTIVARRTWDRDQQQNQQTTPHTHGHRSRRTRTSMPWPTPGQQGPQRRQQHETSFDESATTSANTSRPETETEDDNEPDGYGDGDGDVEMSMGTNGADGEEDENIPPPPRRTIGIVADSAGPTGVATAAQSDPLDTVDLGDSRIIINANDVDGVGGVGVGGLDDGIVALDQNDDLAMGAPPGAPGAIDGTPRVRANTLTIGGHRDRGHEHHGHGHHRHGQGREELTPRAVLAALPHTHNHTHAPMPVSMNIPTGSGTAQSSPSPSPGPGSAGSSNHSPTNGGGRATQNNTTTIGGVTFNLVTSAPAPTPANANNATIGMDVTPGVRQHSHHSHRSHRHYGDREETGPFKEEDVLLSLQLLAYLSKYPHVRQAFYKKRLSFHPATAQLQFNGSAFSSASSSRASSSQNASSNLAVRIVDGNSSRSASFSFDVKQNGFFKSLAGRGKERAPAPSMPSSGSNTPASSLPPTGTEPRMTNVFSLVERFTFRPSPEESDLPSPPPFLPPEIQYWAGVIMRNACRKDESRGGIRQCANMLCGKWESYPREFAKCRRCRKAKYCGKECQSRAWSEGHRFWCSAREIEGDNGHAAGDANNANNANNNSNANDANSIAANAEQHVNHINTAAIDAAAAAMANAAAAVDDDVVQRTRALMQSIVDARELEMNPNPNANVAVRARIARRQARTTQHHAVSEAAQAAQMALLQQLQSLPSEARSEATELATAAARYHAEQLAVARNRARLEAAGILRPHPGSTNSPDPLLNYFGNDLSTTGASSSSSTTRTSPDAATGSRVVPIVTRRRGADAWNTRPQPQQVQAVPIAESTTVMPMAVESREEVSREWDSSGSLSLQNRIQAMDVRDQHQLEGFQPAEEGSSRDDDEMILG